MYNTYKDEDGRYSFYHYVPTKSLDFLSIIIGKLIKIDLYTILKTRIIIISIIFF